METEQTRTLDFSKDDWNKLISSFRTSTSEGRHKFKKGVDFAINDLLKKRFDLACWLDSSHNFFRQTISIRSASPYWRGTFNCLSKGCGIKFTCLVQDLNEHVDVVKMQVAWKGHSQHSDCRKARQCRGEERKMMAMQAMADGVSKTQTANIIANFDAGNKGDLTSTSNVFFQK